MGMAKPSSVERRIARLQRSADPCERAGGYALAACRRDPLSEGSLYIRLHSLPPVHRQALEALWGIEDPWRLVRRLRRFFGV